MNAEMDISKKSVEINKGCIGLIQLNLNSRQSWKQLQEQISSLGNVTFLSLFYVQPETLDTYLSAEDIEALKQTDQEKL